MDFTASFMAKISDKVSGESLPIILQVLQEHVSNYDIVEKNINKCAEKKYKLPEELTTYIIARKIEGMSENTSKVYKRTLENFLSKVQKPLDQITANDIRNYLFTYQSERKIQKTTLDKIRMTINSFFEWLTSEGYLTRNVCKQVKPIKGEIKERGYLSSLEMEKLRSACESTRDRAVLEVLYSTACRVSELVILKKSDINFENGTVHLFGKGSKHRTSYLNTVAAMYLQQYMKEHPSDNEYIFRSLSNNHKNEHISTSAIQNIIKKLGKKAKLNKPVYPHLIRHTTATIALERGMDITEIQRLLGHASVSTTMVYARVKDEAVQNKHKILI